MASSARLVGTPGRRGFQVEPRRWKIEQTFGCLQRYRRLRVDDEASLQTSRHMTLLASVFIIGMRLERIFQGVQEVRQALSAPVWDLICSTAAKCPPRDERHPSADRREVIPPDLPAKLSDRGLTLYPSDPEQLSCRRSQSCQDLQNANHFRRPDNPTQSWGRFPPIQGS